MNLSDHDSQAAGWTALRAQIVEWAERHHFKWRASTEQAVEVLEVELTSERDNRLDLVWFKPLPDARLQVDFMNGGSGAQKRWTEDPGKLASLLEQVQTESDDWASFMAAGPGRGH
jgi:hypothetical protein